MRRQAQRISVVVLAFSVSTASAQVLSGGVAPIQNAAAAGARSPGQMVTASFARLDQVMVSPFRGYSGITETPTPHMLETFQSQAGVVLAQQLTIAINLIVDALLTRSGITQSSGTGNNGTNTGGDRTPGGRKIQASQRSSH